MLDDWGLDMPNTQFVLFQPKHFIIKQMAWIDGTMLFGRFIENL